MGTDRADTRELDAPTIRESCQHRSACGNDGAGNPERLCRKSDRRADHRRRHWRSYHGLRRGIEEDQIGRAHAELQSLMRISYAVFCLKKKKTTASQTIHKTTTANTK